MRLQPYLRSSADTFEQTGRPHVQTREHPRAVRCNGPRRHAEPAADFRRAVPRSVKDEVGMRANDSLDAGAPRIPPAAGERRDSSRSWCSSSAGRREGTFETGIQLALQRILASPKFVFRVEQDPADAAPGAVYRISDLELASRLSFFLWSSIPDDELLTLAAQGRLKNPQVLEQQVRRMLADPKSRGARQQFRRAVAAAAQSPQHRAQLRRVPGFRRQPAPGFRRETEMFFESIMREDRNVLDLMTADYTFVNERLARHYGIPDVLRQISSAASR